MKYLLPIGGEISSKFGILITPSMRGIPRGIRDGHLWAGDNECFTKDFDLNRYMVWMDKLKPYKSTCLFITCPDTVGNARETILAFEQYHHRFSGWPLAFVAQDNQELLQFPDQNLWHTLFVGGTTKWKMGLGAASCIKRAQALGKKIHIGRVNYLRRYQYFASMEGSEDFTCDGTRIAFQRTKALEDWTKYMERPKQYSHPIFNGDRSG